MGRNGEDQISGVEFGIQIKNTLSRFVSPGIAYVFRESKYGYNVVSKDRLDTWTLWLMIDQFLNVGKYERVNALLNRDQEDGLTSTE